MTLREEEKRCCGVGDPWSGAAVWRKGGLAWILYGAEVGPALIWSPEHAWDQIAKLAKRDGSVSRCYSRTRCASSRSWHKSPTTQCAPATLDALFRNSAITHSAGERESKKAMLSLACFGFRFASVGNASIAVTRECRCPETLQSDSGSQRVLTRRNEPTAVPVSQLRWSGRRPPENRLGREVGCGSSEGGLA